MNEPIGKLLIATAVVLLIVSPASQSSRIMHEVVQQAEVLSLVLLHTYLLSVSLSCHGVAVSRFHSIRSV